MRGQNGKACVSFLFATPPTAGVMKTDAHWHRWTTDGGFAPGAVWHHVAVAYRFGDPDSVRGWIDGKPGRGLWDMGGADQDAPVVDDDAIWIASSQGGAASNSFRGSLDSIALHREILEDKLIAGRYRREGKATETKPAVAAMPDLGVIPVDAVAISFHEGMPAHERWLNTDEAVPPATMKMVGREFLLPRLPQRYDDWGIRESWKAPVLVRMGADLALPAGKQRILIRARGLSRLWIDGKQVASTKALTGSPSGEEPITPVAKAPLPGARIAEHRLQESIVAVECRPNAQGTCRVVFEAMAGGKKFRAEPGELTVALQDANGEFFSLFRPSKLRSEPIRLTDTEIEPTLARIHHDIDLFNDQSRHAAAADQDEFWEKRHAIAQIS
ncbi:MAG: hypothetical protein QM811_31545 [Pirellulales bacterium]